MRRESFFLEGLPTGPNLSHAVRAGNTLYLAGQVALTPDRQVVGEDDPLAQSEEIFRNIEAVLVASGASFDDVVKMTCYVSRPDVYPCYAEVRSRYLLPNRPAETALIVGTMLDPRLLLEVEVVAVLDDQTAAAAPSGRAAVSKGYIIVTEAIHDEAGMVAYAEAATPSFREYGGTVLIMDGAEVLEGAWPGTRTVITEFESVAKARAWYTSPAYRVARPIRQASADCNVVLASGVVSNAETGQSP